MCNLACRALDINAVYAELELQHKIEIDPHKCTCPTCTVCLAYCPEQGLRASESRRI
jgi:hypothetical protein